MPTGYTAPVEDGKITDFTEFAMNCARAFGALVELRDDMAAPIPNTFKAHSYHADALARARAELKELNDTTEPEAETRAEAEYRSGMEAWEQAKQDREVKRHRLQSMLDRVNAWTPPTKDHQGLKTFMAEQLSETILLDCDHDDERWIPKRLTAKQWREQRLKHVLDNIEYHKKNADAERKRAGDNTAWVRALRDSLNIEVGNAAG